MDSELAELRKQCMESLYLCSENVAKYVEKDDKYAQMKKLKSLVEDYCMLEAQEEVATQALEKAKRETDTSNVDSLEDRFKAHLGNMAGKRLNVNNHPYMTEFNRHIERGLQMSVGTRENLDESDLAVTESQNRMIDPITKRPITDPVKNTQCGHVYERDAIINLINKRKTRCPVVGCGNREPVQKHHLLSDEELKFRLTLTQHSTMIQERSIMNLDESTG